MSSFKNHIVGGVVRRLGHRVRVDQITRLSPRLLRLGFTGETLADLPWTPGDKIKLQIAPGVMRSYTPSRLDRDAQRMEVIVHLHGQGPASAWAESLVGGEETVFLGPAKSMRGFDAPPAWALFLGDETTIGLAQALSEALPEDTPRLGAIELAAGDRGALARLGLDLDEVTRGAMHGEALVAWLGERALPSGDGAIWLSGEANSVLWLRNALSARGFDRPTLRIKPYWSVKGAAYRKELERGALSA